ncbi:MAG: phosphoribosyltransferase family protein [Ferruginibacter sp.]
MIVTQQAAENKLQRMALQVAEKNYGQEALLLIGIKENGIHIARHIARYLVPHFPGKIDVIALSLNKKMPDGISLSEERNFTGKRIVLVDDVANSGRTMMYALKPLLEFYPAQVETLVLVERTHKHFPVAINYCGISVSTTPDQNIVVEVEEGIIKGADFAANQ